MDSLFIMHKPQFQKIDPYDWFCGPGLHIYIYTFVYFFYMPLAEYAKC